MAESKKKSSRRSGKTSRKEEEEEEEEAAAHDGSGRQSVLANITNAPTNETEHGNVHGTRRTRSRATRPLAPLTRRSTRSSTAAAMGGILVETTNRLPSPRRKKTGPKKRSASLPAKLARRRSKRLQPTQASTTQHDDKEENTVASPKRAENYTMVVGVDFDQDEFTQGIAPWDQVNVGDPFEAPELVTDIYQRLAVAEEETRPLPYTHNQRRLTSGMRYALVNRMVEIQGKCRFSPHVLYLSINIMDRYCNVKSVGRSQYYLVAMTSLFLTAKYEDIYCLSITDCLLILDGRFTKDQVLGMENDILKALDYRLSVPTAYPFLLRFLYLAQASKAASYLASYFLDRAMHQEAVLGWRPSIVAVAAVCLALNHPYVLQLEGVRNSGNPGLPSILLEYTGFPKKTILTVAQIIQDETLRANSHLQKAYKKYNVSRFLCISSLAPQARVNHITGKGDDDQEDGEEDTMQGECSIHVL